MADKELVVVTHGFAGKRLWMRPIGRYLRKHYDVVHWSYFSLAGSIEDHGRCFFNFLTTVAGDRPLNIVAHSMGCVVSRVAFGCGAVPGLSRMVMLAPPNRGSRLAQIASPALGWACKPLREISASRGSFVNQLSNRMPCETGIIAAKFDALVHVAATGLPNVKEHLTLNATHNSLLISPRVYRFVQHFLEQGSFGLRTRK